MVMTAKTELEEQLRRMTEGLTPLEIALVLAQAMRDAYGKEWVIRMTKDGNFEIESQ